MDYTTAVIGGSGFIASYLQHNLPFSVKTVTRHSLANDLQRHWPLIIVAAPTGNRLRVAADPAKDWKDCQVIISALKQASYDRLLVISTVDTYDSLKSTDDRPGSSTPARAYGHNRFLFEQALGELNLCQILRLPLICHGSIKKNFLYDLKHSVWLDKICLHSQVQWYPLSRLCKDIDRIIQQGQKFTNLTSPPMRVGSVVERFRPDLLDMLSSNSLPTVIYDVRSAQHDSGYLISLAEIYQSMDDFFGQ